MKTLIVGDIHLKARSILPEVDEILEGDAGIGRVVFVGDICDEWGASEDRLMRELEEFADWVEERRRDGMQVDVLFGNHDFQYLLGEQGPGTQLELAPFVHETLFSLGLQIATLSDGFLVTHAGVTQAWCDEYLDAPENAEEVVEQLNGLLEDGSCYSLGSLFTCGPDRGGFDLPGPLWADRYELQEDPLEGIPQIVGHTPVETAALGEHLQWSPDAAEIWFCDTFSLFSDMRPIGDGSMLLVDEGAVRVVKADDA